MPGLLGGRRSSQRRSASAVERARIRQLVFAAELNPNHEARDEWRRESCQGQAVLTRKNHALQEPTSSLRVRKLLDKRCASVQEQVLKTNESNKLFEALL